MTAPLPTRAQDRAAAPVCDRHGSWWWALPQVSGAAVLALAATAWPNAGHAQSKVYTIGTSTVTGAQRFATLRDFRAAVPCLNGGDQLLFEAGQTFRGNVDVRLCKSGAAPIEIRSFDPAAPQHTGSNQAVAQIDGSESLDTLGLQWKRLEPANLPPGVDKPEGSLAVYAAGPIDGGDVAELFVGDTRLLSARAPNAGQGSGGGDYFRTSSITDRRGGCAGDVCLKTIDPKAVNAIRRAAATAQGRPTAHAVVRNSAWSLAASPVAEFDSDGTGVRLTQPIFGPGLPATSLPKSGFGFILVGSLAFLDRRGEWTFDRASQTLLLLWDAGSAPAARASRVAVRAAADRRDAWASDAALSITGTKEFISGGPGLVVTGLALLRSAGPGVRIRDAAAVQLRDLRVDLAGQSGIVVNGANEARLAGITVTSPADNGIILSAVETIEVRGSSVTAPGRIANQRAFGMDFAGIRVQSFDRAVIAGNRVSDAGYAGIIVGELPANHPRAYQQEVEISRNRISGFCVMLNDCGGIYVNGQAKPEAKDRTTGKKRVVDNELSRPVGNQDGTPGSDPAHARGESKAGADVRFVGAIYLDHKASGWDVSSNKVSGSYEPWSWRVLAGGVRNGCSRDNVASCEGRGEGYGCYTPALASCNTVLSAR